MPLDHPIIDIHTHMWRTREIGRQALAGARRDMDPRWTGTIDEHLETMKAAGITRAVILLVTPTREMRERALAERGNYGDPQWTENSGLALDRKLLERMDRNNTWGCAVSQQYPEFIPFVNIDPNLLAGDQLANYVRNRVAEGARGVKLLPPQHRFHANDTRLWPMYAYLEEMGLPVLSQSGAGGLPSPVTADGYARPRYFGEAAAAFPKLNFILAHFGTGYVPDVFQLADRYPNIHVDVTAIVGQIGVNPEWTPERAVANIRRMGVRQVLFGTNFPFSQDREKDVRTIDGLDLTAEEKRQIFFQNAERILDHGRLPAAVASSGAH